MKKISVMFMVLICFALHMLTAMGEGTYELRHVEYSAEQKIDMLYLSSRALTELAEASYTEVNMLPTSVVHGYSESILGGQEPVWIVTYYNLDGSTKYRVLLGCNGELMDYVIGEQTFSNTGKKLTAGYLSTDRTDLLIYSDLYNEEGKHFFLWSHEERKAFSDKWKPILQENLDENPDTTKYVGTDIWLYTHRTYGIPNEMSIDEAIAVETAKTAIQAAPAQREYGKLITTFYDVTDAEHPQWRIYIDLEYFIIIDAYSGKIVRVLHEPCNETDLIGLLFESY